jgi:hypothetical protein
MMEIAEKNKENTAIRNVNSEKNQKDTAIRNVNAEVVVKYQEILRLKT